MPRKLHVIPRLVLKQARGVNETLQHQVASTLSSRKFSNCLFDISGILVYRILINTVIDIFFQKFMNVKT